MVFNKSDSFYEEPLKATKTVLNSEHTRRQSVYHEALRNAGYKAMFVCGFYEAKSAIDKYLKNAVQ